MILRSMARQNQHHLFVSVKRSAMKAFIKAFPLIVGTTPAQIEEEEAVEVNVTSDLDMGTIYSVAVPVKRVKATARIGLEEDSEGPSVSSVEWNAEEWDADPSARFPWGT